LTLTGVNLSGATAVTFDGVGVIATLTGGGSDASLPISVAAASNAAIGLRNINVVSGGNSTIVGRIEVVPATPTITSVSVTFLPQNSTVSATITGTNLEGVKAL